MAYIYKITNDINDKIYIGKTNFSIKNRFKQHCKDSKRRVLYEKRPLYEAMNKYGIEHFHIEEIEECSETEASEKEIYWIKEYNSYYDGYNATLGGDGTSYIDYDEIIKLYKQGNTLIDIYNITGHDPSYCSKILKSKGIEVISSSEILKKRNGKPVKMIDKNTNEVIMIFDDCTEAGKWLLENNKSKAKTPQCAGAHIGQVCNHKRKTTVGYKWEWA